MLAVVATFAGAYGQNAVDVAIEMGLPWQPSPKLMPLLKLSDRDPAAAFAEVRRIYQGQDGVVERAEATLASYLLAKDFTTAAETFKLVTQPLARQSAMIAIVPRAFKRDPSGTRATIRDTLSGHDQSYAYWQIVMTQLKDSNWRGAIQTQMGIEDVHLRSQAILNIGLEVARADLGIALGWREQLTGDDQKHAHMHIRDALCEARDDAGLERLLALTPLTDDVKPGGYISWGREQMIMVIVLARLDRGDSAGIARLRDRLPANEQDLVDAMLISANETLPPADRIARLSELQSGPARSHGISRVVALEWEKDPEQTKAFVLALPEATFGEAFAVMARQWEDKRSLSEWIGRIGAGLKRERAISNFVMTLGWSRNEDEQALAHEAPVVRWPVVGV